MSVESKSSALPMPVVDEATWLTKRKELLEKEKQLMKLKVGPCHPAVGLCACTCVPWRRWSHSGALPLLCRTRCHAHAAVSG